MYSSNNPATIFLPSEDEATELQPLVPCIVLATQVLPESEDLYEYPGDTTATNLAPLAEEATALQFREPAEVRSVHV